MTRSLDQSNVVLLSFPPSHTLFALKAGLRLAGIADGPLEARLTQILLKFGFLFQAQDDFLDCFGDPSVTGQPLVDRLLGPKQDSPFGARLIVQLIRFRFSRQDWNGYSGGQMHVVDRGSRCPSQRRPQTEAGPRLRRT